jgi:RNA polymerase sigma-70 factor (ECF subfamily)
MPVADEARTRRFEAVALPHLSAAYNLARWICRNDADAADVVQEAVMRALQYFDSYRGGDARAWLLQIVRNSAHTWIARNRLAGQVPLEDSELDGRVADAATISADPMHAVAAQIEGESLRRAIAQLPLEQREVLILREFEDLSYRQIADVIASPIGTVMSRLSRARDQLAAIMRRGQRAVS